MKLLLSPDPSEGSGSAPATESHRETSTSVCTAAGAPPPAATTVLQGEVTEETLKLRKDNEELQRKLKERETEVSKVQDDFTRYKQTVEAPKPTTKAKSDKITSRLFKFEDDEEQQ